MKNLKKLAASVFIASSVSVFGLSSAIADTVRVLHVENNEVIQQAWRSIADEFEAQNPDVDIDLKFLENEAFKTKLTTLLQSDQRPDIFYSWGGGVLRDQVKAGVLQDISAYMNDGWANSFGPATLSAFEVDGKMYGAPYKATQVGFWYNKEHFKTAGVEADGIKTWDDLLVAVDKLQSAGFKPISVGAGDKWPMHFYWAYLAMRIGGEQAIKDAIAGKGDGFASEPFIKASEELKRLADRGAFPQGFMAMSYFKASGMFGDGNASMHLMGDWDYNTHRSNSVSKEGLSDAQLGYLRFPTYAGGKGNATDTLGGVNGWVVTREASPSAIKWLQFFLNEENQSKLAKEGFIVPTARGADKALDNKFKQMVAQNLATTDYLQMYLDQALGADVGRVVNDISVELAAGDISPLDAAKQVQEAWDFR